MRQAVQPSALRVQNRLVIRQRKLSRIHSLSVPSLDNLTASNSCAAATTPSASAECVCVGRRSDNIFPILVAATARHG